MQATYAWKHNSPSEVDEIGLICPNVLQAAELLESKYKGMKIFCLGSGSPRKFKENSKNVPFTTRVGFGFYKGVILEHSGTGYRIRNFFTNEYCGR
ncbi:MAG: hypothetical protein WKG06_07050 [Segetibacter sp.]